MSEVVSLLVYSRQNGLCMRCGSRLYGDWYGWSKHHRKLRSRGGGDESFNIIGLCGQGTTGCHGWVTEHVTDATDAGFVVASWDDAELVPVYSAEHGKKIRLGEHWEIRAA